MLTFSVTECGKIIWGVYVFCVDRNSSVVIATRYGLDGPGKESRWGQDIPHPSRPDLGPTQPPYTMGTGSFPGVRRPGPDVEHPPHLAPKLRKEYSYTSTRLLVLRGLFQGELYLTLPYFTLLYLTLLLFGRNFTSFHMSCFYTAPYFGAV
jgi:hypothetical protein